MVKDLSYILSDWPTDAGAPRVRKFTAPDGLTFIQVRVDLGVLQMAVEGRPDCERPSGYDTMLDCLRDQIQQYAELEPSRSHPEPLNLAPSEWQALIREVLQFYRRRVSLIALARQAQAEGSRREAAECYRRAIRDAEHSLAILDFLRDECSCAPPLEPQEPYRPFILMQRASCQAEYALLLHDPDGAIEILKQAVAQIQACSQKTGTDDAGEGDTVDIRAFMVELQRMERRIRRKYRRRRTLNEQLEEAIAAEDYEKAARLRDVLSARAGRSRLDRPE